jgi:8-oxo-dGTP pyrophosphatase MutT (NUDIX family)
MIAKSSLKSRQGSGCVIIHENQILLSKRAVEPYNGFWEIPGGRKELEESHEECAVREVREELGLDVKVVRRLGVIEVVQSNELRHVKIFLCEPLPSKIKINHEEVECYGYFNLEKLPTPMVPFHLQFIKKYQKNGESEIRVKCI